MLTFFIYPSPPLKKKEIKKKDFKNHIKVKSKKLRNKNKVSRLLFVYVIEEVGSSEQLVCVKLGAIYGIFPSVVVVYMLPVHKKYSQVIFF